MVDILNNPDVAKAVAFEESKAGMIAQLAEVLMSTKVWRDMDKNEQRVCIRHIVSQAESEEDLRQRLAKELGVSHCAIDWHLPDPNNKTDQEALMLVKGLGGLVSKNGAMIAIMTAGGAF